MQIVKISKSLDLGIVGRYQSYKFQCSLEATVGEEDDLGEVTQVLNELILSNIQTDIEHQKEVDENFKLVFLARDEDLQSYKKILTKRGVEV